jgi:DNA-directed RNA polymerase subunit RPC12/RpoP
MKQEKIKRFLIFCEPCSYKKIYGTDSPEDLTQIKVSSVPGGSPRLEKGKTVVPSTQKQLSKVKCPKCGRGVVLRPLPDVYSKSYDEIDKKEQQAREASEKRKRIEDGTPQKYTPPEFLG